MKTCIILTLGIILNTINRPVRSENIPVDQLEKIAVLPHRVKAGNFSALSVKVESDAKNGPKTVIVDFTDIQSTYSPVKVILTNDIDELHKGRLTFVLEVFYALRNGRKVDSDDRMIISKGNASYQWKTVLPNVAQIDGAEFVFLDASGYHKLPISR